MPITITIEAPAGLTEQDIHDAIEAVEPKPGSKPFDAMTAAQWSQYRLAEVANIYLRKIFSRKAERAARPPARDFTPSAPGRPGR